jgi:hypothetical protein
VVRSTCAECFDGARFANITPGERVTLDIAGGAVGGLAVVAILDTLDLLSRHPDYAERFVDSHCTIDLHDPQCQQFLRSISQDDYEAASLWGHACYHSSSSYTKQIANVTLNSPLDYLMVAYTQENSYASMEVTVNHTTPRSITEPVCGAWTQGSMPPPGQYTNEPVGSVLVDVHRRYPGSTLTDFVMNADTLLAEGGGFFSLSTTQQGAIATVLFTGTVLKECEPLPPPCSRPVCQ